MAETLILTGAGGCMRELLWQIQEQNCRGMAWEVLGYVDVSADAGDVFVGGVRYPCLGTDDFLLAQRERVNVAVCGGSSVLRRRIAEKLMKNPHIAFPNLILADACICPDVRMGQGNIISMDCRISTNVAMGDFNFLNMGAVVCHDGRLGDYVTMSPGAWLAGNVSVGSGSELGMGTKVIQGIRVGSHAVTGAGCVVIEGIPDHATVVGVPGRVL